MASRKRRKDEGSGPAKHSGNDMTCFKTAWLPTLHKRRAGHFYGSPRPRAGTAVCCCEDLKTDRTRRPCKTLQTWAQCNMAVSYFASAVFSLEVQLYQFAFGSPKYLKSQYSCCAVALESSLTIFQSSNWTQLKLVLHYQNTLPLPQKTADPIYTTNHFTLVLNRTTENYQCCTLSALCSSQ